MALRAVHRNQMIVATVLAIGTDFFAKLISFVNQPVVAATLAAVVCAIVTAMFAEQSSSSNSKIKQLLEVLNVDHVHAAFSCIWLVVVNHANFLVHGWYNGTLTTSFVEKHSCVSLSRGLSCKTLLFRLTFGRQMIISRSVVLQH